mmetsp:Transcript_22174/g.59355  ORF Transcript_22174/g.59355 Transcript_22174/m.59355 type:complete len:394 (+) Transcript_22174:602-1783(+)
MDEAPVELRRWHVPLEVLRSGGRARVGGSREVHGPPLVGVPPDLEGGVVLPEEGHAQDPQRALGTARPRLHDHELAVAAWLSVARDPEFTHADEALEVPRHRGVGHVGENCVGRQDELLAAKLEPERRQFCQIGAIEPWLEGDRDKIVDRLSRYRDERRAAIQQRPAPILAAELPTVVLSVRGRRIMRKSGLGHPDAPRVLADDLHALEVLGLDQRRGVAPDHVPERTRLPAQADREHPQLERLHHRGFRPSRQSNPSHACLGLHQASRHRQPRVGEVGHDIVHHPQAIFDFRKGRVGRAEADDGLEQRVGQRWHVGVGYLPEGLVPGRVGPDRDRVESLLRDDVATAVHQTRREPPFGVVRAEGGVVSARLAARAAEFGEDDQFKGARVEDA